MKKLADLMHVFLIASLLAGMILSGLPVRAQAADQRLVVEGTAAQRADAVVGKQIAGQRGDAELGAGAAGFEELEDGEEREPVVAVTAVGRSPWAARPTAPSPGRWPGTSTATARRRWLRPAAFSGVQGSCELCGVPELL